MVNIKKGVGVITGVIITGSIIYYGLKLRSDRQIYRDTLLANGITETVGYKFGNSKLIRPGFIEEPSGITKVLDFSNHAIISGTEHLGKLVITYSKSELQNPTDTKTTKVAKELASTGLGYLLEFGIIGLAGLGIKTAYTSFKGK
ncbi:MAG: hypothetical protein QXG00_05255 [Candidatus Woesearchaeota archaeon]